MKTVGIIAEYNPFHNGHAYHIAEAKRSAAADCVVVVMSGDYVQRGLPAMTDKYTRTHMALLSGADIVLELPVCFATGSAELFAAGAVAILGRLGIVDCLCFGSECGDLELLTAAAALLSEEPDSYKEQLNESLRAGLSFPAAREAAIRQIDPTLSAVLASPNNILGIEYLKAIRRFHPKMKAVTIKRSGSGYHESTLSDADRTSPPLPSATAIRNALTSCPDGNQGIDLALHIPACSAAVLDAALQNYAPITSDDFSSLLHYALHSAAGQSLASYLDVSPELEGRIRNTLHQNLTFTGFADALSTRQYTRTRINRALLHILLGIHTEDIPPIYRYTAPSSPSTDPDILYARILGLRSASSRMLRSAQNSPSLPIITKVADAPSILPPPALSFLQKDIFSSDLYHQAVYQKSRHSIPSDYYHGLCIIQ